MNAVPTINFVIPDLQTGYEIINRMPLANPPQAAHDLERLLDSLLTTPPDGEVLFQLLEQIRQPLSYIGEALAKHYLNKALPLAEAEEEAFQQTVRLNHKAVKAYAKCTEKGVRTGNSGSEHAPRIATILHRCLLLTSTSIFAHQRARRELPRGIWRSLHGFYVNAETWKLAEHVVTDPLDPFGRSTHCSAAYTQALLFDMASPYSLTLREQILTHRWASLWSPLIRLQAVTAGDSLPPFLIDLKQDMALRPLAECLQTENLRRMDTSALALQISQTRQQLKQRVPPAELSLGEGCTASQCQHLLGSLARPWSQARAPRKFRRHATSGRAQLCSGFEEMHFHISGREFAQPQNAHTYSRINYEHLYIFRDQVNPEQPLQLHKQQFAHTVDDWEVVDQSANGFRLMRSTSGRKMEHGQLLALCPHDGEHYLLARITWLMQEKEGGLVAGVMIMPGIPVGIAARETAQDGKPQGQYYRAFLLPPAPPISTEQTLVLPQGAYRYGSIVELFTDTAWRVRLKRPLDSGPDYERVSFELC